MAPAAAPVAERAVVITAADEAWPQGRVVVFRGPRAAAAADGLIAMGHAREATAAERGYGITLTQETD